jgi:hypothetical protein
MTPLIPNCAVLSGMTGFGAQVSFTPAGPVRLHEKGGKQHAMRVIKRSPRSPGPAGDRTQGRSGEDSGFVFGDLAPLVATEATAIGNRASNQTIVG